jgi:hypothetical protein
VRRHKTNAGKFLIREDLSWLRNRCT